MVAKAKLHLTLLSGHDRQPVFSSTSPGYKSTTTITFFEGSQASEISNALKDTIHALKLTSPLSPRPIDSPSNPLENCSSPSDVSFVLEDPKDGSFVAITASMPSNMNLNCLLLPHSPSQHTTVSPLMSFSSPSSRNTALGAATSGNTNSSALRASIVKVRR